MTALVLVVFGHGGGCPGGRPGGGSGGGSGSGSGGSGGSGGGFGGGSGSGPGGWPALGAVGAARVRAAADYVAAHADAYTRAAARGTMPRIVFTGGWAEVREGAAAPPLGWREGDLMLRRARAAGLDRYAELRAETRSRSTLENLLHTVEEGLLAGHRFGAGHPLGLVSHAWHLPRVRYLAGKVLGLRGPALLDVAAGGAAPPGWPSERITHVAARLCFLGARDAAVLRWRERAAAASMRRAERLLRPALRRSMRGDPAAGV